MKKLEFCDHCQPNGQLLQEQLAECETKAKLLTQENNGLATGECARCRYADGCRERVVIEAALQLYHVGLAPSASYWEFREAIQASGLYETWRGNQRSVRGSSGSRSLRVSDGCSGDGLCSVAAPCASCLERYPAL